MLGCQQAAQWRQVSTQCCWARCTEALSRRGQALDAAANTPSYQLDTICTGPQPCCQTAMTSTHKEVPAMMSKLSEAPSNT